MTGAVYVGVGSRKGGGAEEMFILLFFGILSYLISLCVCVCVCTHTTHTHTHTHKKLGPLDTAQAASALASYNQGD